VSSFLAALLVAHQLVTPTAAVVAQCHGSSPADFDGDGKQDLAVGAPYAKIDAADRAGMVSVSYADRQVWLTMPDRPARLDAFGGALATGDFNGDHCGDLAVGVPGRSLGPQKPGEDRQGAVQVFMGSPGGLVPGPLLTRAKAGSDRFGTTLAAADVDGDHDDELVVGAPGVSGGGAVLVFGLRGHGLKSIRVISAKTGRTRKRIANGDGFGAALATGDFNGDGRAEVAIGIPGDGMRGSGSVTVLDLKSGKAKNISQIGSAVSGGWETGDHFGAALAAGDFNGDGKDDLAIGVPGEALTAGSPWIGYGEGVVHVLYGPGLRELGPMWSRKTKGVPGSPRRTDFFGTALAAGNLNGDKVADLAIGVPGGGAVQVLYGKRRKGLTSAKARLVRSPFGVTGEFGLALVIKGRRLLVGAPGAHGFAGTVVGWPQPVGGRGLTGFVLK
jgi:hypothetical protein